MGKIESILEKNDLTRDDIIYLLSLEDKTEQLALFTKAYDVKKRFVGTKVFFRGLIELSNVCIKNCFYCGIRKDNSHVNRYTMTVEEVLDAAKWANERRYGSVVIQSGERSDPDFVNCIENIIRRIKAGSEGLGITLSLGEQTPETYKRWFDAGAHRYLLRIETSSRSLYQSLHPADHSFDLRLKCLENIKNIGYQVGTGVMTGLPGQTMENLADDILFFKEKDIDMIGMGPYIPHHDTPMAQSVPDFEEKKEARLSLGLRMIAAARVFLKDVNIASTTALQSLNDVGREMGLLAGANIIMPNITDTQYRKGYQLYDGKPCLDENAVMCVSCLENRIRSIGEEIGYGAWGDSPHVRRK